MWHGNRSDLERRNLVWQRKRGSGVLCRTIASLSKERGPQSLYFWDLMCMRARSMRNSYQTLHGDQTGCMENLYTVDYEYSRAFCLRCLTLFRLFIARKDSPPHRPICIHTETAGNAMSACFVAWSPCTKNNHRPMQKHVDWATSKYCQRGAEWHQSAHQSPCRSKGGRRVPRTTRPTDRPTAYIAPPTVTAQSMPVAILQRMETK